jgi:hypothetical protein
MKLMKEHEFGIIFAGDISTSQAVIPMVIDIPTDSPIDVDGGFLNVNIEFHMTTKKIHLSGGVIAEGNMILEQLQVITEGLDLAEPYIQKKAAAYMSALNELQHSESFLL